MTVSDIRGGHTISAAAGRYWQTGCSCCKVIIQKVGPILESLMREELLVSNTGLDQFSETRGL